MSAPRCTLTARKTIGFSNEMQAASDNIKKQALAEGEEVGKKVFKAMEDLQTACDAIDVFMKDNPSDLPGSKKRPIVFAQWLARFGRKNFKVAEEVERPFEKEEWLLRCIRKRGLTREQGEEIWNEAEADSKVERSETGYRGQLRLWLTANEQKRKGTEQFVEEGVNEMGAGKRDPSSATRDALRRHAAGSASLTTSSHEFFEGESNLNVRENELARLVGKSDVVDPVKKTPLNLD